MKKSAVQEIKDLLKIDQSIPIDCGDKRVWINVVSLKVHRENGPAIEYKNGASVFVKEGSILLEEFIEDKITVEAESRDLVFYVNGIAYSDDMFTKVFL